MRNLLLFTLVTVIISFGLGFVSYAACGGGPTVFVCDTNPPNPDLMGIQEGGNNADLQITAQPGAAIHTAGQPGDLDCIDVGDGNNQINLKIRTDNNLVYDI